MLLEWARIILCKGEDFRLVDALIFVGLVLLIGILSIPGIGWLLEHTLEKYL